MKHGTSTKAMLALAFAGMLAIGPALAKQDKDEHPGKGKGKGHSQKGEAGGKSAGDPGGPAAARRAHFEDRHRVVVSNYYSEQYRAGRCPPGLAKKNNGCMPPGQAKKWNVGQPLPRDVVFYSVPQTLVARIGPPPSGCRYVRVASDILVVTISTRVVVDVLVV
jgi:Ni/Co efflux regulator RcnB